MRLQLYQLIIFRATVLAGIAYHSSNGKIYVTNLGSGTVSVIDGSTNKVDSNIKGFFNPAGVAYDPDNGKIYVTNKEANMCQS